MTSTPDRAAEVQESLRVRGLIPQNAHGRGYGLSVEGPVYQADDDGRMRLIDGAHVDPRRPFYLIPDEAAHEQGDEPSPVCAACAAGVHEECLDVAAEPALHSCECTEGACRGEWVQMGYTEDRLVTRQLNGPDLVDGRPVGPLTELADRIVVDVDEVRRTAEAIEVLATMPGNLREAVTRNTLDGLSIAEHRPVPVPPRYSFHLPSALGGLPEPEDPEGDPNEPVRYVTNRADRRRLMKGKRRRG